MLRAGNACAERRARVLRYPDLAKKLTQPPVGYTQPEHWNGWIPPRIIDPEGREELAASPAGRFNQLGHRALGQRVNDSPRRGALVDIAAEALRREQEATP